MPVCRLGERAWAAAATPFRLRQVGAWPAAGETPELVLSGINQWPHLGPTVFYSVQPFRGDGRQPLRGWGPGG